MGKGGGGGGIQNHIGGAWTENDVNAYSAELMGAPRAQAKAIPYAIDLEKELLPTLQSYYFNSTKSNVKGLSDMYGSLEGSSIASQGKYGNALADMYGRMGTQATLGARNSLTADVGNTYDTFTRQASQDLALGTELNRQETDIATGAARAAAQKRGLQFSRQGGDLEILNTYSMGQNRQNQRRQVATQAYQMGRDLQNYGGQAYLSPAMQGSAIYSIPGLVGGANEAFDSFGPRTLSNESQYLANLRANRLQGEAADAQARASRSAGVASGIGSIIGAGMMLMCWVAREAYGKDNPKWMEFRSWMIYSAPEWLYNLYVEHGEEFAEFISNKPILKWMVRKTMDAILAIENSKVYSKIYA